MEDLLLYILPLSQVFHYYGILVITKFDKLWEMAAVIAFSQGRKIVSRYIKVKRSNDNKPR